MQSRKWLEPIGGCVNVVISCSILLAHGWILVLPLREMAAHLYELVPWAVIAVLVGVMGYRSSFGRRDRRAWSNPLLVAVFATSLGVLEILIPDKYFSGGASDGCATYLFYVVALGMLVASYDGIRRLIPLLLVPIAGVGSLVYWRLSDAIPSSIIFAAAAAALLVAVPPLRPNRMVEGLVAISLSVFLTSHLKGFDLMHPPIHCWFHGPYDPLLDLNERELERSRVLAYGAAATLPWLLAIMLPWKARGAEARIPSLQRAFCLGLAVTTLVALAGTREHLVRSSVTDRAGRIESPSVTLPTIPAAFESLEGYEDSWPVVGIGATVSFDGRPQPSLERAIERAVFSYQRLRVELEHSYRSPKGIAIQADAKAPMQDVLEVLAAIAEAEIGLAAFSYEAPLPNPLAPSMKHAKQRRRAAFTHIAKEQAPLPCRARIFELVANQPSAPEPRHSPRTEPIDEQEYTFVAVDPQMTYGDFLQQLLERFDFRFREFWIRRSWSHAPDCAKQP
jgi:hypothetical protein